MEKSTSQGRIALAIEYPLLQQGGMEVLLRYLIPRLVARFELVLVSRDADRDSLGEYARHIAVHHQWIAGSGPAAASELAANLKADGVSLVHFHGSEYEWERGKLQRSPIHHAISTGLRCLVTTHLTYPLLAGYCLPNRPLWQKLLLLPKAWLSQSSILRGVATEVLVSKSEHALMRGKYPLQSGKFRQMYHSRLERGEPGLPPTQREKVVMSLGTFCERKGQAILVRAFASVAARNPEWKLHLVGRTDAPEYFDQLKALVAQTGLSDRVQILPPVEDPRPALRSAAIFAMPSLVEPLGLSLQEAMFLGCAVVGSDVGGIPEMIDHEKNGLLVAPGDVAALAGALDRLMSDAELRAGFGESAPLSIEAKGMLADAMVENHVKLYEAILVGRVA